MDKVNIYIYTTVRGPGTKSGSYTYLLEYITDRGPATLTKQGELEQVTENQANLQVLIEALQRLKKQCEVTIWTESRYLQQGAEHWIHEWQQSGWMTARKKTGGKQGRMGKGRRTTGATRDQLPGGAGSFIQKLDPDGDREKRKGETKMFDRFGEFDSAAEINETAVNLRREGDIESLKVLAAENGIDPEILEEFAKGKQIYLCDDMVAALGKLDVEVKNVKCAEIMEDWVEYIRSQCFEHPEMARAVRKKGKSLAGCIAALLHWSFKNQNPVDKEIMKAAGVTAGRCTLGIPGMATAKKIITNYYLGK